MYTLTTQRCEAHGGHLTTNRPQDRVPTSCQTEDVLVEVAEERERQFKRYGTNEDLELGMGPTVRWLSPYTGDDARAVERALRADYEQREAWHGKPTWMHLIREEVAEAFTEGDPVKLRAELLQVAALAVSAVEKLDARAAAEATQPEATPSWAEVMARVTGSVGATYTVERVQPDGSVVEVSRETYGDVS